MKNKARLFGIYLPVFAFILIGAVTLRTIATINFFNFKYHYFTDKTLSTISAAAVIAAAIFFVTYTWSARKDIRLIPSFASPANYIPSAAVSAALIFVIAWLLGEFKNTQEPILNKWIPLLLSVFAVLSILHFIFNTIFIRTVSIRRADLGICTVIFLCLYVAYLYFDTSKPINSPVKITDQMAYLFAAVFFLYEIRLSLGREKWKSYIAFGFIASLLTAYSSIPAIITYFASGRVISSSIYESILTLTLFFYITSKLLLTGELINDEDSPFVIKLKAAAEERVQSMNPTEEIFEEESEVPEDDENQISISEIEYTEDSKEEPDSEFESKVYTE